MINKKNLKSKNITRLKVFSYSNNSSIKSLTNLNPAVSLTIRESRVHEKSQFFESTLFFNVCFDKTVLKLIIIWFLEKYGEKITVDIVETLKQIGFHQATCAGVSLGVDDLKIPHKKAPLVSQASVQMTNVSYALQAGNLTSVEKSQRLIDTWNQTSEILREAAVLNFRTKNPVNPVYMMAFSGARGNMSQVRQLVAMRGLMADPQGAILEFPIQSNFREGLTVTEYLISCYGARKGLVDTALRTATSGYLTRRLVVAVQHVVIHVINCKTTKGLVLRQKNLQQKLIGRVLLHDTVLNSQKIIKKNTVISSFLAKQLAVQYEKIHVRSPLTCQTEKSVCQLCFGIDLAKGKLVSLGEAVGVIAAQSIGEPGTQLTMRTFHTGGVGVFSDQAMKSFIAPFSGKVHFPESLSGIFVRTPHGNSVYLLKHKTGEKNKTLLKLTGKKKTTFLSSPTDKLNLPLKPICYEIKHQEVSSGSILWVKQGQFVERGQILLQASRLEATKQEMPESSHPVQAPFSGEIFFQYIKTQCIEEEIKKPKNQKSKQKEILPTFLTLTELGTFWLFSCFIQKQNKISTQFFVQGDLISPKTPTQQYNLEVPYKSQLKIINSEIFLAQNSIKFLFSKISYSKGLYFINEKKNLLVYKESSTVTRLTYYPFFNRSKVMLEKMQGFYISLTFEKNGFKEKSDYEKRIQNIKRVSKKIYLVSPYQVWCLKRSLKFLQNTLYFSQKPNKNRVFLNYSFIITHQKKLFSKSGFFQLKPAQHKIWSQKNLVEKKLLANYRAHFLKVEHNYSLSFSESNTLLRKTKGQTFFSIESCFLKNALKKSHLQYQTNTLVIKKTHTWIYISKFSTPAKLTSQLSEVLLEPGKTFDNLFFPHCYISINVLNKKNISFLQGNLKQSFLFYSLKDILVKTNQSKKKKWNNFSKKFSKFQKDQKSLNELNRSSTNQKKFNHFCFYKKQHSFFVKSKKEKKKKQMTNTVFDFTKLHIQLSKKQQFFYFICLQKKFIEVFPTKKCIYQTCYQSLCNKHPAIYSTFKSPLFSKQVKTGLNQYKTLKPKIEIVKTLERGWFSPVTYFKFYIDFQIFKTLGKVEEFQQKIVFEEKCNNNKKETFFYDVLFPGLSIAFYRKILLDNAYTFCFQTFDNDSVLPHFSITKAFYKAKNLGEFRRLQNKQKKFYLSLLRHQDLVTLILPKTVYSLDKKSLPKIGARIRWSQELIPNFASSLSGQIIKFTPNRITLRKGLPFLASIRGLLHINEKELIQKKDLLMTLRSRRLETEDIVQGIPKIEQLFEARETHGGKMIENSMHKLLNHFFNLTCRVRPLSEAVELSFLYIQKFLIKNIVEAYSNQGVYIAEKHVEVVVRQMTARVRIIDGGQSDFLPGELVQLRHIEKLNSRLAICHYRQATYEPIILGITKSALQSESFLLAASFQQVSKVLVKSALSKKTDFLQGLHENILVGQHIPAGTGIIDFLKFYKPTHENLK